jgi:hypothetical protein
VNALDGDLLSADRRFDAAVAAYDRALVLPTAGIDFARALALLLAGRCDQAIDGHRRGVAVADTDDRRQAVADLLRRTAAGGPGTIECLAMLEAAGPGAAAT